MAENIIKAIPEFTSDENPEAGIEEEKQAVVEEATEPEKETQTEPPAVEKPGEQADDTGKLMKQIGGLETEREKLLKEIQDLRGTRREIKQDQLEKVEGKLDELQDLHPDDINVIEKVLRAKGYITKDEASKMTYDNIKQEELDKFLTKYPEYKPDNDKNDINWSALQREISYYRMPTDARQIGQILEKAHKSIQRPSSDRSFTEKKNQLATAGIGAGGTQRSSSKKSLEPRYKEELLRGGWSEEEIKKIESNLP